MIMGLDHNVHLSDPGQLNSSIVEEYQRTSVRGSERSEPFLDPRAEV